MEYYYFQSLKDSKKEGERVVMETWTSRRQKLWEDLLLPKAVLYSY